MAFADFKAQIRDWAVRSDWSDDLVTSYIRMAEERLNQTLRIDRMIKFAENFITCRCAEVPDDWLAMHLVEIAATNTPDGFAPIRYHANDEFFNLPDYNAENKYTLVGRTIYFGGSPDATEGKAFKIAYYAEVPVFSDTQDSWVYDKYPTLYLFASLLHSNLWSQGEEAKSDDMAQRVDAMIAKLNAGHMASKASGSRITRIRTRSFG